MIDKCVEIRQHHILFVSRLSVIDSETQNKIQDTGLTMSSLGFKPSAKDLLARDAISTLDFTEIAESFGDSLFFDNCSLFSFKPLTATSTDARSSHLYSLSDFKASLFCDSFDNLSFQFAQSHIQMTAEIIFFT